MQRSITTSIPAARARFAASSWTTPSCIQITFAPRRIAASTTSGTIFGPPEDIHDLDRIRHFVERGVGLLAQHFGLIRIDRRDRVPHGLHEPRHPEARSPGVVGQAPRRRCVCISPESLSSSSCLPDASLLELPLEALNLFLGQKSPFSRFQPLVFEKADPHAAQLFDGMP